MAPEPTEPVTPRTPVTAEEITAVMSADLFSADTLGMIAHRVHLLRGLPCGAHDPRVTDANTHKALATMIEVGTVVFAKAAITPTRNDPAALIGARSVRKGATYYTLATRAEAFRKERADAEEARVHAEGVRAATRTAIRFGLDNAHGSHPTVIVELSRGQAEMLLRAIS